MEYKNVFINYQDLLHQRVPKVMVSRVTRQCSTLTFWAVSQQPLFPCVCLTFYQPSGPMLIYFSKKMSVLMRNNQPLADGLTLISNTARHALANQGNVTTV